MPPKSSNSNMSALALNAQTSQDKRGLSQSIHNPYNGEAEMRPEHFIIRKGNGVSALVPLVPVDLLPTYVEIVGVPRELTIGETVGMSNLGEVSGPRGHFQLRFVTQSTSGTEESNIDAKRGGSTYRTDTESPRDDANAGMRARGATQSNHRPEPAKVPSSSGPNSVLKPSTARSPPPVLPPPRALDWAEDTDSVSTDDFSGAECSSGSSNNMGKKRRGQEVPTAVITTMTAKTKEKSTAETANRLLESAAAAATRQHTPNPANSSNSSGKKYPRANKYKTTRPAGSTCRHWCQTGHCNWGTDCRFTHQMPVTLEGLADAGLAELPAWWRKAAGLPSEGAIDLRIFSAAAAAAAGANAFGLAIAGSGGGKKSSALASPSNGATTAAVAHQSKKSKQLKAERDERKLAEEVQLVRLGIDRTQLPASALGEAGKRKPSPGHVQMKAKKAQEKQQYGKIDKLLDI